MAHSERGTHHRGPQFNNCERGTHHRSFVSRLCALDRKLSGTGDITDPVLRKQANRLILGHAILWAAALVASTVLLVDSENVNEMSTLVMIPLWFASYMLITNSFKALRRDT